MRQHMGGPVVGGSTISSDTTSGITASVGVGLSHSERVF